MKETSSKIEKFEGNNKHASYKGSSRNQSSLRSVGGKRKFRQIRYDDQTSSESEFDGTDESAPSNSESSGKSRSDESREPNGEIQLILARKEQDGIEQFYVKWFNLPYLYCSWISSEDLLLHKPQHVIDQFRSKERNVLRKQEAYSQGIFFNQDYLIGEKIVHHSDSDDGILYLVKWKSLGYADSTWHPLSDIPNGANLLATYQESLAPRVYKQPLRQSFEQFETCPEFKGGHQLRPYQLEGMNWICFNWHLKRGCILADEMGLGKTIQAISLLHYLQEYQHISGPFLIIAPLSTLSNWTREIMKWTHMRQLMYHGTSQDRQFMRENEFHFPGSTVILSLTFFSLKFFLRPNKIRKPNLTC